MDIYKVRQELASGKAIKDLPLRVTFYARVSTDHEEQVNSLVNQIDYFQNYIKDNPNWTYVEGYIDKGISGKSVKGRKKFLQMIEDAKRGKFDLIITKEISRFSRNLADSIKYTEELLKYNVGLLFQTQNLNTFDPNSELPLNMMRSMAQDESQRLSQRVTWGLKQSAERGKILGNDNIIGYKKDKAKLVIVPEEAKFVKEVFTLYATGKYGFCKLAKALYDKGYTNSLGKIYEYNTLRRMIENPKYKGYNRYNTTRTADYRERKQVRNKKEEWIIVPCSPDIIPPIVSEELWDKCNEIADMRNKSYNDKIKNKEIYKNRYTYSGLLWCAEHNVTFQRDTGSVKIARRPTWACGDYRRYHTAGCLSPIIPEEDLDSIFKNIMKEVYSNKEGIIKEMLTVYSSITTNVNYDKDISALESEIKKIEVKKEKLLELNIEGKITNDEFGNRNDKFNKEIVKIKTDIEKLKNEQRMFQRIEDRLKEIETKIRQQFNFENNLQAFVKQLVEKIVVSKIDDDRRNIKLDIYLKIGNHLEYGLNIGTRSSNSKIELYNNHQNNEFITHYGGYR